MPDIDLYISLITSWHRGKPQHTATVAALATPAAALTDFNNALTTAFDLDTAVGVQLDKLGEWIGRSRRISIPIADVYFSFDTDGLGFDQGYWLGPFDPLEGLVSLDDDTYRVLLQAKVAANHWDGTIPGAVEVLQPLADLAGVLVYIEDDQLMHMVIGIAGHIPDVVMRALLIGGYIPLEPVGVGVGYYIVSVDDTPLFGFDAESDYIAGFDVGSWGVTA